MAINSVTKSFHYTFKTILHAKLRNFVKKSFWRYLIGSLLLAYALKFYRGQEINPFPLLYFCISLFGFLLLSIILMTISSQVLYLRKRQDNIDVTFTENEIEINWTVKGRKEIKGWDWIKGCEEVNGIYYLDLDVWPRNVLMVGESNLSTDEKEALRALLKSNGKIHS